VAEKPQNRSAELPAAYAAAAATSEAVDDDGRLAGNRSEPVTVVMMFSGRIPASTVIVSDEHYPRREL
jgi:hypothetical protein